MFFRGMYNEKLILFILVLTLILAACAGPENANTVKPATVNLWNISGQRVDIYKNLNPEYFDPTTWVCMLNPGEDKTIDQYPSYDQVIGDVFYPRFKIRWANSMQTGTTDIYIEADRVLLPTPIIIKSGGTYSQRIDDVKVEELKFLKGYIVVKYYGNTPIQIIRGTNILSKLDDNSVYINANKIGFYEIPFSYLDTSITMNQLKAFSSYDISFPSFTAEKGKMYIFTVQQDDTVTGPIIKNIWENWE
jgi:hypothetical protein